MATTPKLVNAGAFLNTGTQNLYTVPANETAIITKFTLTNTTTSSTSVSIYLSDTNTVGAASLLQTVIVGPNGTYIMTAANHNINAGGAFLGTADVDDAVIVKISAIIVS